MIERSFVADGKTSYFIKDFLRKELRDALISKIDVIKTPLITRIVIYAARPGLIIGRKGSKVREITEEIKRRFKISNPQIEVIPVENPTLDAQVQAERIALSIERGMAWRPLINMTLRRIMEAGAQGAEIIVKGKLGARNMKSQKGRVYTGYMKKVGDPAKLVDTGFSEAFTKWGIVGVTVRIVHPDTRFPDKISVPEIKKEVQEDEGKGAEVQDTGGTEGAPEGSSE